MRQNRSVMLKELHPQGAELTVLLRYRERTIKLDGCNPFIAISEDCRNIPCGERDAKVSKKVCRFIFKPTKKFNEQIADLGDLEDAIGFRFTAVFERRSGDAEFKTIFILPRYLDNVVEYNFEIDDIEIIEWLLKCKAC